MNLFCDQYAKTATSKRIRYPDGKEAIYLYVGQARLLMSDDEACQVIEVLTSALQPIVETARDNEIVVPVEQPGRFADEPSTR